MELLLSVVFLVVLIAFPALAIALNYLAHRDKRQSLSVAPVRFEHEHHPGSERSTRCEVLPAPAQS